MKHRFLRGCSRTDNSMAIGVAVGTGFGIVFDNLALGLAIGLALGFSGVLGCRALSRIRKD